MAEQPLLFASGTATFSSCGFYRYSLTREIGSGSGVCNFVMLNPSTADAAEDDPTIRRCVGFSRAWGYAELVVTNLFAYRSTDPTALATAADPIGPDNDAALLKNASRADVVVCAWGCGGKLADRWKAVHQLLTGAGIPLTLLRLTKSGHPSHPLYLPGSLMPTPWVALAD